MTFIVAEGVVFIVNDFSVGIVIPCDTQLAEMLLRERSKRLHLSQRPRLK